MALDALLDGHEEALVEVRKARAAVSAANVGKPKAIALASLELAMFESVLSPDPGDFDGRLIEYLLAYRAFWGKDLRHVSTGMVSLAASAAMVISRERGLQIGVGSDYICV